MTRVTVFGPEGGNFYFGDVLEAHAFARSRRAVGYRVTVKVIAQEAK